MQREPGEFKIWHKQRHYAFVSQIGSGCYGRVYKAVDLNSDQEQFFAIKRIDVAWASRETLRREIQVHAGLNHPNVVALVDSFRSVTHVYIVTEFAGGGTLRDRVVAASPRGAGLGELETRRLFQQILRAVAYLQRESVAHRDLKLENIVLDHDGNVKLVDFGFANALPTGLMYTRCGTLDYMPPEIVEIAHARADIPYGGFAADMWSCGVILFVMLTGRLPFHDVSNAKVKQNILDMKYTTLMDVNTSHEARDLLAKLLVKDPVARLSVEQALAHQWCAGAARAPPSASPTAPPADAVPP